VKPYILAITAVLLLALGSWWRSQPLVQPEQLAPSDRPAETHSYRWQPKRCWFDVHWQPGFVCGTLHPPAHPPAHPPPEHGDFELAVVIIRAPVTAPDTAPLLYLQGGPGLGAGLDESGIEYWLDWFSHGGLDRDLVLMDPRGVGHSRPALTCEAHDRYSARVLTEHTPVEDELESGRALLARCFSELMHGPTNFQAKHYGTQQSARDIVGLMSVLDYPQWHLLGVSYGTRLALAVAVQPEVREHNWVRSMILDSVYPPERGGLMAWPREFTQSLERFFSWCEQQPYCRAELNDVEENFQNALAHLRNNPVAVTVPLWRSGSRKSVIINDHRFIAAVFSAMYQHHLWAEIPRAIRAALNADSEGMALLVETFINSSLNPALSLPAFYATDCRDHPSGSADEYQQALHAYPQYAHYLQYAWEYRGCIHFPPAQSTNNAAVTAELAGEIPTLLLAGELDPITPAHWAQALAEHWPASQLKILPARGHSIIGSDDCVHRHFNDFLNQPEQSWHPECLEP